MDWEMATIGVLRPEGLLAWHLGLEGELERLRASHDRPAMRLRLRLGEIEQEVGIASPPGAALELLVERATPLGAALAEARPGQEIEVSEATGWGVPLAELEGRDLYLVGNGVGIGVVRAVALAALAQRERFRSVHALCEAHYLNELPYREEYPDWQAAGARVYQLMQRPDMGKWRDGEAAYIYEELADIGPDPERSAFFAAGPDELLGGVAGLARRIGLEPDFVYTFELPTVAPEHGTIVAARPPELLEKLSLEGRYGSGHQDDVPDHGPVYHTPSEQPRPIGLPPYKRPHELADSAH